MVRHFIFQSEPRHVHESGQVKDVSRGNTDCIRSVHSDCDGNLSYQDVQPSELQRTVNFLHRSQCSPNTWFHTPSQAISLRRPSHDVLDDCFHGVDAKTLMFKNAYDGRIGAKKKAQP